MENQIQPWALGRSNWLFAGSLCSGQRAAAVHGAQRHLIAEYEYNALGQRTRKSHAGTETHFVHGRNGQLIGEYNASGQVIREYVYLEGDPLAMIHQGAVYYFQNDQLGSPLKLTDSGQNVAWDGVRAPFGEMSVTASSVENPLRFPGQYFDAETGLHQNWFRDYDPGLGRYIQEIR